MSTSNRAVGAPLLQVRLRNGTTWTGTEAQLRREHPDWLAYATPVASDDMSEEEAGDTEQWQTRFPLSTVRYHQLPGRPRYQIHADQVIPLRAHRVHEQKAPSKRQRGNANTANPPDVIYAQPAQRYTDEPAPKRKRRRIHPLVYLGFGMLAMLLLWQGIQTGSTWWQMHQDDITYGRPRTYQFDAVVGHNDSASNPTHFLIENLNRHVIVIELPGGDISHARIYAVSTLYGDGQDLTPVTGKAEDVNGDGKPDLVFFIQDQHLVYINDGRQFRPLQPGEHVRIPS